jgi:plasmid maintenance system killer protein
VRVAKLKATIYSPEYKAPEYSEERKRRIAESKRQWWADKKAGLLPPTDPEKAKVYAERNARSIAKRPKKSPEETKRIRGEAIKRLNADENFQAKRIAALQTEEASAKISAGVYASMERRLATMQTPEVQAKLRRPKSAEHKQKCSESAKKRWAERKAMAESL